MTSQARPNHSHDPDLPEATGDGHGGAPADGHEVFAIDAASAVAPFRQLHEGVVAAISDGRLTPGQKLPTVRALAAERGLAPNTVAKAYKSLEAAGVIEGRGRAGTFVSLSDDPVEAAARTIALQAAADLRALGIDVDHGTRLLRDAFSAF